MSEVIAVAGDWHGSRTVAREAIYAAADVGASKMIHLGDFGFWYSVPGALYRAAVMGACDATGLTIEVVPGNHENPREIARHYRGGPDVGAVIALRRGERLTLGERTAVALGGAPSMDRSVRVEGVDWWPEELITDADIGAVIAGGEAEIMLAHDAPDPPWQTEPVAAICQSNPFGFPDEDVAIAADARARITRAVEVVRPRLYLHGHYHVYGEADTPTGRVVSLAADGRPGSLILLDTDTLDYEVLI